MADLFFLLALIEPLIAALDVKQRCTVRWTLCTHFLSLQSTVMILLTMIGEQFLPSLGKKTFLNNHITKDYSQKCKPHTAYKQTETNPNWIQFWLF